MPLKMRKVSKENKESNWELEGEKVTGPKMEIKELPVIQFNLVIGL